MQYHQLINIQWHIRILITQYLEIINTQFHAKSYPLYGNLEETTKLHVG